MEEPMRNKPAERRSSLFLARSILILTALAGVTMVAKAAEPAPAVTKPATGKQPTAAPDASAATPAAESKDNTNTPNVATSPVPAPTANPVIAAIRAQLDITTDEPKEDEPVATDIPVADDADVEPSDREALKAAQAAQNTAPGKSATQALKDFYAAADRTPLFASMSGLSEKAQKIRHEFEIADQWGLRPQDFTVALPTSADAGRLPPEQAAKAELTIARALLKYARYAKGGRIDPRRLSRFQGRGPRQPDYEQVMAQIAASNDVADTLHGLHPNHPEFEALRQHLLKLLAKTGKNDTAPAKKADAKPDFPADGPWLRLGTENNDVVLLRKRLGLNADVENAKTFDAELETALKKFQKENDLTADGVVGPGTRQVLAGEAASSENTEKLRARLLINMERWRWMPDKFEGSGNIYVWANIPELRVRIIKNGNVVFSEKAIAGLPEKQTPMFSDAMEWIEINPTWFIPNSIKVADVLPSLKTNGRVMKRYHLKIDCGRDGSDWQKINWDKVDIRRCSVTQPAGEKSVLGDFKFKFPNPYSVYMHDTLTPGLFNQKHRILSHGCVRVQHPLKMAEVLLGNDKGMSAERVQSYVGHGLHRETLRHKVPVHITYFSTRVNDNGTLGHYPDYYGHDKRLAEAMLGLGHLFKGAIYHGSFHPQSKPRTRERVAAPRQVLPRFMLD